MSSHPHYGQIRAVILLMKNKCEHGVDPAVAIDEAIEELGADAKLFDSTLTPESMEVVCEIMEEIYGRSPGPQAN